MWTRGPRGLRGGPGFKPRGSTWQQKIASTIEYYHKRVGYIKCPGSCIYKLMKLQDLVEKLYWLGEREDWKANRG